MHVLDPMAKAFLFSRLASATRSSRWLYGRTLSLAVSEEPAPRDEVVRVRVPESGETLDVALTGLMKLQREKQGQVSKTLERIALRTQQFKTYGHLTKKEIRHKRRLGTLNEEAPRPQPFDVGIEANLYTPTGGVVKPDTPNVLVWEEGSLLVVGPDKYRVCVNSPAVISLTLPPSLKPSCTIDPKVSLEFADSCKWEWFRCTPDDLSDDHTPDLSHLKLVDTSRSYSPSDEDVGCKLLLRCTPTSQEGGKTGEPKTIVSEVVSGN